MTNTSSILSGLRSVLQELEPGAVPLPEVSALFGEFAQIRRLAGSAETLLARRVDEAREWARAGYPSVEDWLAAKSGTSVGEAKDRLKTSDQLRSCGATAEAMRSGLVSPEQAGIVADAAAVNPDAERDLLQHATRESNKNLRDEAARRKAQGRGESGEERARRHRRERKARAWTDRDGKRHLHVEGPVAMLAGFEARWEREIDRQYRAATKASKKLGRDAYAFDAFLSLTKGDAEDAPKRPRLDHLALIRVDLAALTRGHVEGGEVCEIAGCGPISVQDARSLLGDSVLKLVITDGVDVANLTHLGRGPSDVQKLAILWSSQQCTVAGCHRTHTEYDHRIQYSATRHTRIDELDRLCDHHHDLKTYKGWALVAGSGKRELVPPDDPRHPDHPSPTGTPVSDELAERFRRIHQAARPRRTAPSEPGTHDRTDQGDLFDLLM